MKQSSKNNDSKLIFAIIGFGSIARKHISSIQTLRPKSEICILTSQAIDPLFSSSNFTYYSSLDQMLERSPDYFIITSAANDHGKYLKSFLRSNKKILIEKPVAHTLLEGKRIEQLFIKERYSALVAYNLRFSLAFSKVLDFIKIGKLGNIYSVQCVCGQNLSQWRLDRDLESVPSVSREKGGGVLRELSHELDYLYKIFGSPHSISGYAAKLCFKELDVEDTAMFHLVYNYNDSDILVSLNLDFVRHDPARTCHIIGSEGTLLWDLLSGSLSFISKDGQRSIEYSNPHDLQNTNMWMWEKLLNDDISLFCTLREGVQHLEIIEDMEVCEIKQKVKK